LGLNYQKKERGVGYVPAVGSENENKGKKTNRPLGKERQR